MQAAGLLASRTERFGATLVFRNSPPPSSQEAGAGEIAGGARIGQQPGRRSWVRAPGRRRSEEHTSELQSLMRISYAVFCLKKKKTTKHLAVIKSQQKHTLI